MTMMLTCDGRPAIAVTTSPTGSQLKVIKIGELVEDHELVFAGVDDVDRLPPSGGGVGTVGGEIVGVPREPVAEGVPVDAELTTDLLLADLPVAGLDELHDRDVPPRATARTIMPNAADDLPFPSPVFTTTSNSAPPKAVRTWILGGSPVPVDVGVSVEVGVGFAGHEWGSVRSDHYDVELSSWQRSSVRIRRCPATVVRRYPYRRPARSPAAPTPTSIPRGKGRFAPAAAGDDPACPPPPLEALHAIVRPTDVPPHHDRRRRRSRPRRRRLRQRFRVVERSGRHRGSVVRGARDERGTGHAASPRRPHPHHLRPTTLQRPARSGSCR